MSLTVVILTLNEARHITRALASVEAIADRAVVVDSGSTDATVSLARATGAEVLTHPFVNQAQQFNWALDQLGEETDWVLRLDADEIVTPELANEIGNRLDGLAEEVRGVSLGRRIVFLGRPICWGGLFPVQVVRLFRHGHASCEDRWMDEHMIVDGPVISDFAGEIHDINLNPLGWWIAKHNSYAAREVIEILDRQHGFLGRQAAPEQPSGRQARAKRWIKERVYERLPGGLRAVAYFFYRFVVRFGFLDGKPGTIFHVLQGFWYRYLVDAKLFEVQSYMENSDVDIRVAIQEVLGIAIDKKEGAD
jgi:glycosyltransferase involved in cell wall biosynthesis